MIRYIEPCRLWVPPHQRGTEPFNSRIVMLVVERDGRYLCWTEVRENFN